MPHTVDEQLSQAIATQLATCTVVNGYAFQITSVIRPVRRDVTSLAHGQCRLQIETYEQGDPEGDALGLKVSRTAVWAVDVYVEPSDTSTTPYDQLRSNAIGEVERCLVAAMNGTGGRPFGGLGHNAELRAPQMIIASDNAAGGFRVNLAVSYRYLDSDPYTALN